jgi:hypothetical protein
MEAALALLLVGRAHSLLGGRGSSPGYSEQLEAATWRALEQLPPRHLARLWRRAAGLHLPAGFRPWQQLGVRLLLLRVRHLEAGDMVDAVAALVEAGMVPAPAALMLCLRLVFTVPVTHAPDHEHQEDKEQGTAAVTWQQGTAQEVAGQQQQPASQLPPALAGLTLHHHLLLMEALARCRARLPTPWWRQLCAGQVALLPCSTPQQLLALGWAVVRLRAAPVMRGAAWLRLWCGLMAAAAGAGALGPGQVLEAALLLGHLDLLPARTTLHCGAREQLLGALEAAAGPGWQPGLRAALSGRLAANAAQLQAAWAQRPAVQAAARNAAAQLGQQRRGGRLRGRGAGNGGDVLPGVVVVGEAWAHRVRGLQLERRALLWTAAVLCSAGGRRAGLVRRAAAWLLPHAPMLNAHVAVQLVGLMMMAVQQPHRPPPNHQGPQQAPAEEAAVAGREATHAADVCSAGGGGATAASSSTPTSSCLTRPGPAREHLLVLARRLVACLGWAHSSGTLDLLTTLRRLQAALGGHQEGQGRLLPQQYQQQLEVGEGGRSSEAPAGRHMALQVGRQQPLLLTAVAGGGRGRQLVGGAVLRSLPWLPPQHLGQLLPAVVALAGRPPPGLLLVAAQQVAGRQPRGLTTSSSSSREVLAQTWFVVTACALASCQVQPVPAGGAQGRGVLGRSRQLVTQLWQQLAGQWQQQKGRRNSSSGWLLQLPLLLGAASQAGLSQPAQQGDGSRLALVGVARRHLGVAASLGLLPAAACVPVMARCAAGQLSGVLSAALAVDWAAQGVRSEEGAAAVAWQAPSYMEHWQQRQQGVSAVPRGRGGAHPLAVASLQLRLTGLLRWAFVQATLGASQEGAGGSVTPGHPVRAEGAMPPGLMLPPPRWAHSRRDGQVAAAYADTLDFQGLPHQLPGWSHGLPAAGVEQAQEQQEDVVVVMPLLSAALELKFARVVREVVAAPASEARIAVHG